MGYQESIILCKNKTTLIKVLKYLRTEQKNGSLSDMCFTEVGQIRRAIPLYIGGVLNKGLYFIWQCGPRHLQKLDLIVASELYSLRAKPPVVDLCYIDYFDFESVLKNSAEVEKGFYKTDYIEYKPIKEGVILMENILEINRYFGIRKKK